MRRLAVMGSVLVLAACGPSEAPLFERQAGMWKADRQMLSLPFASAITPQQRAAMSPEQSAILQQSTQPHAIAAPACISDTSVTAASLADLAPTGIISNGACTIEKQERTDSGFVIEGVCSVDGADRPLRVDGSFTDSSITRTYVLRGAPAPNMPPRDHRVKIIETRTGDCE